MSLSIRPAVKEDLVHIIEIYNQAVLRKGLTADLDLVDLEDREDWFEEHSDERYPILVAVQDDRIIGWIMLSAYRKGRRALQRTIEVSLYIATSHIGRGVGTDLLNFIIPLAKQLGYQNMIAILISINERSVGLFAKYGFELWGRLPAIVEIDGQTFDHCIYGRRLA